MPTTEKFFGDEHVLLLNNDELFEVSNRSYHPVFETAITKGVSIHIEKWPSHLFTAFITASLVFGAFLLCALATAIIYTPAGRYRIERSNYLSGFPNVYFVKLTNQTWSKKDLCYIEASARNDPEIMIYLVELLTDDTERRKYTNTPNENYEKIKTDTRDMIDILASWEYANNSNDNTMGLSSNVTEESRLRRELQSRYANVRNVQISTEVLFRATLLAHVHNDLGTKTLEIAAKANILWHAPGIALDPADFRHIWNSKRYLCKRDCKATINAAINNEGSFQASPVPCQAFVGYLIHEIATNGDSKDGDVVKSAQDAFCSSHQECPGLEIHNNPTVPYTARLPYCPLVFPPETALRKNEPFANQRTSETMKKFTNNVYI